MDFQSLLEVKVSLLLELVIKQVFYDAVISAASPHGITDCL